MTELHDGSAPEPSAAVYTVELDSEAVLLDEVTGRIHLLNGTGTLVWQCLDGRSTVGEIASDMADVLGVDPAIAGGDVLRLAREFAVEGLLADTVSAVVRWRRRADTLYRYSLDTVVLLPDGSAEPFALTGNGAEVWDLLEEPRDLDDLIDALAAAHAVDRTTVRKDIEPVLGRLSATKAIEPVIH